MTDAVRLPEEMGAGWGPLVATVAELLGRLGPAADSFGLGMLCRAVGHREEDSPSFSLSRFPDDRLAAYLRSPGGTTPALEAAGWRADPDGRWSVLDAGSVGNARWPVAERVVHGLWLTGLVAADDPIDAGADPDGADSRAASWIDRLGLLHRVPGSPVFASDRGAWSRADPVDVEGRTVWRLVAAVSGSGSVGSRGSDGVADSGPSGVTGAP